MRIKAESALYTSNVIQTMANAHINATSQASTCLLLYIYLYEGYHLPWHIQYTRSSSRDTV